MALRIAYARGECRDSDKKLIINQFMIKKNYSKSAVFDRMDHCWGYAWPLLVGK